MKNLTLEERKELASKMVIPKRCGGAEYINGILYYKFNGWLVPEDVVRQAIYAYQDTHEKYIL